MSFRQVTIYEDGSLDETSYADTLKLLKAQKGCLTKQGTNVQKIMRTVSTAKVLGVGIDDLKTQLDLYTDRYHNIYLCYQRLLDLKAAGNKDAAPVNFQAQLDAATADFDDVINSGEDLLHTTEKNTKLSVAVAQTEVKFIRHLQPEKLTEKSTLSEKKVWRLQFDTFYTSSNFKNATVPEQQQYLMLTLSRPLAANLLRRINALANPNTVGIYETARGCTRNCMHLLDNIFKNIHPVYARRNAMLQMRRENGESYTDWSTRVKNAAEEAGINTITHDEFITMMLVSFSGDSYLDSEFQRLENPTVADCDRIGAGWDRGENFKADTAKADHARSFQTREHRGGQNQSQKSASRKPKSGPYNDFLAGKCSKCARQGHIGPDCTQFEHLSCSYCGKPNHVASVCHHRWQDNGGGHRRQSAPD